MGCGRALLQRHAAATLDARRAERLTMGGGRALELRQSVASRGASAVVDVAMRGRRALRHVQAVAFLHAASVLRLAMRCGRALGLLQISASLDASRVVNVTMGGPPQPAVLPVVPSARFTSSIKKAAVQLVALKVLSEPGSTTIGSLKSTLARCRYDTQPAEDAAHSVKSMLLQSSWQTPAWT